MGTRQSASLRHDLIFAAGAVGFAAFALIWERRWRLIIKAISERKEDNSEWVERALHDPLTNLPNRALLRDRIEQSLVRARRNQTGVAVLFIDLDNFKQINDVHGHLVGDQVLIAVGERFRQHLRGSDTAARLGGDEFVVLVDFAETDDPGTVLIVAERLRSALQVPVVLEPEPISIRASIGIAVTTTGEESADDLLKLADQALLEAKRTGKNRVVRSPSSHDSPGKAAEGHR